MMEHIIYKITNILNNRFYCGMHSTDNVDDGYLGSGKRINAEVKKYGKHNFIKEILEYLPSREALADRETEIVNVKLLADPLCLNLKIGGEGGWDHIQNSPNYAQQQIRAGQNGGFANRHLWSAEMVARVSTQLSAGGKKSTTKLWADERDRMLKAAEKGREFAKLPENVEKRKATMKERCHMQGEKNSQFGSCWVTDGVKPVKIKKDLLDEYLAKGFKRGRKMEL